MLRKDMYVIFQPQHVVEKRRASGGHAQEFSYLVKLFFSGA